MLHGSTAKPKPQTPIDPKLYEDLPIGPIVVRFWGLPYRILNMNPKKELLWGLWVYPKQSTYLKGVLAIPKELCNSSGLGRSSAGAALPLPGGQLS